MAHNVRHRLFTKYALALIPLFLLSCIGASSDIKINSDGSGTITQVYRISHELQNMGKTGGTEEMYPLPVGREDLEKTAERIPGLRLTSYSSNQNEKDIIINAGFAFDSPEALAALMENGNQQFKIDVQAKKISIHFPAGEDGEAAFKNMMVMALTGYNFAISFTVPGTAKASWFDGNGKSVLQYPGTFSVRNGTVEYTVPMGDLIYLNNPLNLEINW